MTEVFDNFHLSIDAYRELFLHINTTLPDLEARQWRQMREKIKSRLPGVSDNDRGAIGAILEERFIQFGPPGEQEELVATSGNQEESEEEKRTHYSSLTQEGLKLLIEVYKTIHRGRWYNPSAQADRLYRSIVTGLVAQVEVLCVPS